MTVRTVDSKKHSTGRRVCITGLALALIFCVSAVFAGAEEIVVNFATWASADETAIWRRDIESFEKLHPDIKVNLITCSWNEYPDRVPLYLSGVIEVDILRNGGQHLPTFVQLGGLLPLTPYVQSGQLDLSPFFPQVLEGTSHNGVLYGLPDHFSPWVMYYNVELFNKLGLPTPYELHRRGEWTWEMLEKIVKECTVDLTGDGHYDMWALPPRFSPTDPYVRQSVKLMNGGPLYNADYTRYHLDDPRNIAALEWLVSLREYLAPNAGEWGRGNMAMTVGYPTHQVGWKRTLGFEFGVAPLPRPANGSYATIMTINIMSILQNAKNPDAALKFIQYICGRDIQRRRIDDNYILSARIDVATETLRRPSLGAVNNEVLAEITGTVRPWVVPPIHYERVLAIVNGEFGRVAAGQEPVTSAIARITPMVNAVLAGGE